MTVRQVVLKIHLWLSFTFAIIILIACVTGAALVYRHDIDRALNPSLYHTTPGDVGWDAVWDVVKAQYPSADEALIRGPVDRLVYQVEIGDERLPFAVHVDPGSGRILGARDPAHSLAGWLFLLHFDLFGGELGHVLVGATGIALVLITVTGAWLWWPTIRRFAFGFRIRWRRPFFVVNYDLHRVIGILSLPLVFIVSLTGSMLIFYDVGTRIVHALFLSTPAAAVAAQRVPGPVKLDGEFPLPLNLDDAAVMAARIAPGALASSMYVTGPVQPVKVWLRTDGDVRPNVGSWHVWIDRQSGSVTSAMVPGNTPTAAHVDETWVIALHFGSFGGEGVRALYVVGALVPVVLLVTGAMHWLLRRQPARAAALETLET